MMLLGCGGGLDKIVEIRGLDHNDNVDSVKDTVELEVTQLSTTIGNEI